MFAVILAGFSDRLPTIFTVLAEQTMNSTLPLHFAV